MTERLLLFLRAALPDFLLVLIASVALVYTVSYGFESAPDLRGNVVLIAALCSPLLVILFCGSWGKRMVPVSAALALGYAAAVLGLFASQAPEGVPVFVGGSINDVAENGVPFALVALVCPAALFLLTRRRAGAIVALFATALACAFTQYLFRDWNATQHGTLAAVVALCCVMALVVYQTYRASMYSVQRAGEARFAQTAVFSFAVAALCLGVGLAGYFGVVEGLGLHTPEIKPFQDYYSRPVIEYTGVYDPMDLDDPDDLTNETDDEEEDTSDEEEGGQDEQAPDEQDEDAGSPVSVLLRAVSALDPRSWLERFSTISYEQLRVGVAIAAFVVLAALLLAIALRRHLRTRYLAKTEGLPAPVRVARIYDYLCGRLAKVGLARPEAFTPLEFAAAARSQAEPYLRGSGTDLLGLTLAFQRAAYAPDTLTAEDDEHAQEAYRAFYRNAPKVLGRSWLWRFWVL